MATSIVGLAKGLARIEKSINVKAPPEKVWALVNDYERFPSLMKGLKKIEYLTQEHSGVGVRTHWVADSGGQEIEWNAETTEWDENRKTAWRSTSGMKNSGYWLIQPTEGGTKLAFMMDYELPYSILGQIIDKLKLEKEFTKQIEEGLQAAKTTLES